MGSREIVLYVHPGTCAIIPHILLNHSGLPFKLQPVDGKSLGSDFAATNPKKQVPVLSLDGHLVTEIPAIVQGAYRMTSNFHFDLTLIVSY